MQLDTESFYSMDETIYSHVRQELQELGLHDTPESHQNALVWIRTRLKKLFSSLLFLLPSQNLGFFVSYNKLDGRLHSELVNQFLGRYYPVQEPALPQPLADGGYNRARRISGSYRSNRYARRTVEKGVTLFSQVRVTAKDGTLRLPNRLFPSKPMQLMEVESLLFQQLDDDGYAACREDHHDQITHLFKGIVAFEKLSWYETATFHLSLMGFFVLVFLSACVVCLLSAVGLQSLHVHQLPQLLAGLISTLNLVFLTGLALVLLVDQFEWVYGMPPVVIPLLFIPLLTTVLTVGLPILAVQVGTDGDWSLIERLHYSVITLGALSFIPFLRYWNLLGFRFSLTPNSFQ